jgi:iron complex outermembrane receptor protein
MQKKIYIFLLLFFLRYLFCAKHSYGKITTQGGMPLPEVTHIGKTVSSDVSGNYLFRLPSGNAKIFVSCIGFQPVDTLVNIAFDQVLNFILENTVQLQEVVIRQKSIH